MCVNVCELVCVCMCVCLYAYVSVLRSGLIESKYECASIYMCDT